MNEKYDVIIIGGGPSGMSTGIYAGRYGLKSIIIDSNILGGNMNLASKIENYPGFSDIEGRKLAEHMCAQTKQYSEIKEFETVENITKNENIFNVTTDKSKYFSSAIIFATGTTHKKLNVLGEDKFLGKGISYCATCDGNFFKNKDVVVVGGGNTSISSAIYLRNIGCNVILIHRKSMLQAENILENTLKSREIKILLNTKILEIRGDKFVNEILIEEITTGEKKFLSAKGVFIEVGVIPNSIIAEKISVKTDKEGYIIVDNNQRTNLKYVYACGDVTTEVMQIVTACASGAKSALSAYIDLKGFTG